MEVCLLLKSNYIKLQENKCLGRELLGWLGFASGGCFWGWIYGSGWRGSEWEHQPQPCWGALGFQHLAIFFIVFPFIQQENWCFLSSCLLFSSSGERRPLSSYSDEKWMAANPLML